jgi:hypothetical protein
MRDSENQESVEIFSSINKDVKIECRKKFYVEKVSFILSNNLNGSKNEISDMSLSESSNERKIKGK